ncbi:MAG: cytochrome c3 family protein [bacterium]
MRRTGFRLVMIAVTAAAASAACARSVVQPLAFDHRLHAYNGVPCLTCHATAATGQGATLPTVAVCRRCHEDVLYEAPEEAKIRLAAESGQGLRWVPVFALRPYVYFSHRRHVALGNVSCDTCHGAVETRNTPFQLAASPFAGLRGMRACIRCHQQSRSSYARVDCIDCHR